MMRMDNIRRGMNIYVHYCMQWKMKLMGIIKQVNAGSWKERTFPILKNKARTTKIALQATTIVAVFDP